MALLCMVTYSHVTGPGSKSHLSRALEVYNSRWLLFIITFLNVFNWY
jgi:hypothetical protein